MEQQVFKVTIFTPYEDREFWTVNPHSIKNVIDTELHKGNRYAYSVVEERGEMTNEVEVAKMRAIADFFERNPELTVPFSLYEVRAYAMDKGELAKWAHAMPHPIDKGLTQNNKYYQLKARLTWAPNSQTLASLWRFSRVGTAFVKLP